jgi:hypothetical protein
MSPAWNHPEANAVRREQIYAKSALRTKAVLMFLRAHPNSTADEIFKATGHGTTESRKFLSRTRGEDGVFRYRALEISEIKEPKEVEKYERRA